MEIVLLGHMGRDDALADRLEGHKLHVLGEWENPGLAEKVYDSGGVYREVSSVTDVETITSIVEGIKPDMFLTNFDAALEAGVVDAIKLSVKKKRMPDLYMPCPDRAASRVEWDKFYLRKLIDIIDPKYNPVNFMEISQRGVDRAVAFFREAGTEIAVKPRNLTGGKGVKVQGKHFDTHRQGAVYAKNVLATGIQSGVEIQEKMEGHEFTLQIFTDGITMVRPPTTYDFPYREDGDTGPGTGGTGTFSMKNGLLPFVTRADYDEAFALMGKLLQEMKDRGDEYKGVLYPTFFKTASGIKIVEVNARGGDPELINILDLMEDDVELAEVLKLISIGELATDSIRYKKMASALLYLVSPGYGYDEPSHRQEFYMEPEAAEAAGCKIRYSAVQRISKNHYRTTGNARIVGISALADMPWNARQSIHAFIRTGFTQHLPLDYRNDVADRKYIRSLK